VKIALITDLHANRQAVEAVLEHALSQGAERRVFLGDFVGYGADPGWVVDRVRQEVARGAIAIQGNHDAAVAAGGSSSMRAAVVALIEWTRSKLSKDQLDFLARLPLAWEEGETLYVHANAFAPAEWAYIGGRADAVRSLQATRCRLTFCGHVHEPRLYHLSALGKAGEFVPTPGVPVPLLPQRRWLVIPGAAGQPRDGNPAACYLMHDTVAGVVTSWRVPYDTEAACARLRDEGLPQELALRLTDGR
jgi:diadenosine tetraphosphatase ApaH/serine/threonine PP2A family protein phosphatase